MGASTAFKGLSYQPKMKLLFLLFASTLALPRPAEDAAEVVAEKVAEVAEEVVAEVAAEAVAEEPVAPAAIPYVHEEIEAEPYVHEEIEAEPYVHEEIEAVAYVHEDIPAEEYVHVEGPSAPAAAPLVYTGLPYVHAYAGYPYTALSYAGLPTLTAAVPKAEAKAAEPAKPVVSPVLYSGGYTYPYGLTAYPYLSYHTGCVNNVGSVVPCA